MKQSAIGLRRPDFGSGKPVVKCGDLSPAQLQGKLPHPHHSGDKQGFRGRGRLGNMARFVHPSGLVNVSKYT